MNLKYFILFLILEITLPGYSLEKSFMNPPDSAKPWVIWHWINGNVTKDGITKDLEALHRAGIGGVIQMEVSGSGWAPPGPVEPYSSETFELINWAITESARIGMKFDVTIDYGYGSGGPHITPDKSMQQLVWSETEVVGGKAVRVKLDRPEFSYEEQVEFSRNKIGVKLSPKVMKMLQEVDSYRDVAVFAVRQPSSAKGEAFRIPDLEEYNGLSWVTHMKPLSKAKIPKDAVIEKDGLVDLSGMMGSDGTLDWQAPSGNWQIVRLGHASNFKLTRPSPSGAVGLECDRLSSAGIETHFEKYLRPIFDQAGDHAGRTLSHMFLDSWEAHGQNWTSGFEKEFKERRGYDITQWLPVLTGRVVGSVDMTERFLWDMRMTVSEVMLDNYVDRLMELARPYGIKFSNESYGRVCADSLTFAGRVDFPICEFWTEFKWEKFPEYRDYWYKSMKATASAANTYGKDWVGAEAFTGARGWMDHPYSLKGVGDEAFCNGVNKFTVHSSGHQAYDRMKPGMTHRKWSQNFSRHQTWWEFSKPYFDYISRCQHILQQGRRVVDVACLYLEGAPLYYNDIEFELPVGYDHDLCSPEIIQRMEVKNGRLHLPTGVSYQYLVLPATGKLTSQTAMKIDELKRAGANVLLQSSIQGTPGLVGFPQADQKVRKTARKWDPDNQLADGWQALFDNDSLKPDFVGEGLGYIHRRTSDEDVYFVANPDPENRVMKCSFRMTGSVPEIWDPETSKRYRMDDIRTDGEMTTVTLEFEPLQSWFVVFRKVGADKKLPLKTWSGTTPVHEIKGAWQVRFDPEWGAPDGSVKMESLIDWSQHPDEGVKFYSGTATYTKSFSLKDSQLFDRNLQIDLGNVEVIAKVTLNGKDCGITWKAPYRLDVSHAIRSGKNELKIEVVNTWVNRLIGDEFLPPDAEWDRDVSMKVVIAQSLREWPDWFLEKKPSPSGRYTFTPSRHYTKDSTLMPSGLIGPVKLVKQ